MAYPYSFTPNYFVPPMPYTAPQMQVSQQAPIPTSPQTNAQPAGNSGLIWVQGEAGAKSYIIAPNATVMLMDSEAQRFYLKTADSSGMPLPLRIFEYKEVQDVAEPAIAPPASVDFDKFVTKDELEAKLTELAQLTGKKSLTKKSEVKDDE